MSETKNYTGKAIRSPERVRTMFDAVSGRYDLLNRILTLGRDRRWRKLAAASAEVSAGSVVLDACCGTADLALAINAETGARVVGVDFSPDMLKIAKEKIVRAGKGDAISFIEASVDDIPFDDDSFDAVTVGWGLRNTPDYQAVLEEFYRVVRPGGRMVCLESTEPETALLRIPYKFILSNIVPLAGRMFAKDHSAYRYLSDSIQAFPPQKELVAMMGKAGWVNVSYRNLLGGAVAIHVGRKPSSDH
ncbi:MAG: bifunctional demethylmenaquinone methyltransferase/2-methoxy-6-polyprenyl-1,4-benzoquinol methylase UbiE [Candidatus Aquicultor sp.]|nr:bifunctional demethylmenaquinone methyltransferase/2-methoxy-6-polyprenyl-1,4-benzoquinol methylase UbiE [Candidatus Aquicultor sp.]